MIEKSKYSLGNITNEKVTKYIGERFEAVDSELFNLRIQSEKSCIPIVERDVESLLISCLYAHRPRRILELGTAIGYSSIVMAKALKDIGTDVNIITLERDEEMVQIAKSNIIKFGCEKEITVVEGDAISILKALSKGICGGDGEKFDFVFVDAGKSHYLEFWQQVKSILKKGGIVFYDNVLMRGMTVDSSYDTYNKHKTSIRKMRLFLDALNEDTDIHNSILSVGDGVAISYKKR